MTWNYRVVQHPAKDDDLEWWGLHEVYYTDDKITGWTDAEIIGNDFADLIKTIKMMLADAVQRKSLTQGELDVI